MRLPTLELQEAFTTALAADVPAWETVASSYEPGVGGLRSFSSHQGRSADLDRDAAGTATFVVDVRDRELDPSNTASSHYPNVTPNRPIRLAVGYVAEVLRDNPRSYWRLSDTPLTSFARDDQRAAVGTLTNGVTSGVAGMLDGDAAYSFVAASTQYVDTGDLSLFETGDCTYEAWIKTAAPGAGNMMIVSEGHSSGAQFAAMYVVPGGEAAFASINNVGAAVGVFGTTIVTDNAWHHIVATRNGNTTTLYVDGVAEGTPGTVSGTFTFNNSRIAGLNNGGASVGSFNGNIDEVAVYADNLTATRILAHYTAGRTGIGGYVHSGYVDAHNISYQGPHGATVTIPATDRFKLLARAKLTGLAERPEESTSVRVLSVLGHVDYDFRYVVIIGNAIMMVEDIADKFALDAILDAADTENTRCFIDKNGTLFFIGRLGLNINPLYTTSQATFSDSGAAGVIPYTNIVFENSDTLLRNSVEIDHPTLEPITVADGTSVAAHGLLTYTRTVRDASVAAQNATAEAILAAYKDPQTRVLSVTVPTSRTTATYPNGLYGKVLSLALGMRVTVERTPPGGGAPISQECFVLSQSHSCDATSQSWSTTFGLTLAFDVESYGVWDTAQWDTDEWGY